MFEQIVDKLIDLLDVLPPCLWDIFDKDYTKRERGMAVYTGVAEILAFSVEEIETKFRTFTREAKRRRQCCIIHVSLVHATCDIVSFVCPGFYVRICSRLVRIDWLIFYFACRHPFKKIRKFANFIPYLVGALEIYNKMCVCACACARARVRVRVCACVSVQYIYIYIYIYIYTLVIVLYITL